MAASGQELVDLATIVGGFSTAVATFVAVPIAIWQLRHADRLRRLDFYQGLLMELYASGATPELVYGADGAAADAEASRLRGEASKLIKAAIVLRKLRRLSAEEYGGLFETIESDVRSTLDALADFSVRVMSGLAVSTTSESNGLRDRFELIKVMCAQAQQILGPKRGA